MQRLGIIGVNIQSQNIGLMEHMTIPLPRRAEALQELKATLNVEELTYIATCNRVEFVFICRPGSGSIEVRNRLLDYFFKDNREISFDPNDFTVFSGQMAIRHLFSVASALDSLVLGEAQILGQVKDAFAFAEEHNLAGENLQKIFSHTFKVAKKVRSETDLGKKSVSMISLVTALIKEIWEAEGPVPVALVGAGPMTAKLADFLNTLGARDIYFVNRTVEKASTLAQQYGGQALALDEFMSAPPQARIVCTATSSNAPIFTDISATRLISGGEDILFIDLAIPRDVAFENPVEKHVQIRNINDLKQIADRNRRHRFRDVDKARAIVSREVVSYYRSAVLDELSPAFNSSLAETREFAEKGLARLFETRLDQLDAADQAVITHWVDKLVSYATFLPARTMANQIVDRYEADVAGEEAIGYDSCVGGSYPGCDGANADDDLAIDRQKAVYRKGA